MRHSRLITIMLLLLLLAGGCASPAPVSPAATGDSVVPADETMVAAIVTTAEAPNFLLLVSDEANAIGDFQSLTVLVSGVGFVMTTGEVVEETFVPVPVELVGLTGELAIALWSGYVPEGEYTKVFLYVDEVVGVLLDAEEGETIEIKLPSDKLHISMPVVVEGEEAETEFVFDISVFAAGNSGQYILKPQITESGQGAQYRIHEEEQERLRAERPEWAGQGNPDKPAGPREDTGKPEWANSQSQTQHQATHENQPEDAGKPDGTGKPEGVGTPANNGGKPSQDD